MNQHHQAPWHNVVVRQIMESEDGPEGRAVLLVPRFRWGPLKKWLQPRLKKPYIRVNLDEIGSFVWKRCDGKTTYQEIAAAMRETFGQKAEPAEERLKAFLVILQKNKFASLYKSTT